MFPDSPASRGAFSDFSLPTQRCFCLWLKRRLRTTLFSAYAEVFPVFSENTLFVAAFLCLRRGVSDRRKLHPDMIPFSLPTQRCFSVRHFHDRQFHLFSAYAEVFLCAADAGAVPLPFLCLRRGVSAKHGLPHPIHPLFSAYAEVFPHD